MSSNIPRDVGKDALLALVVLLVDLLEDKAVFTKSEFSSHLALRLHQAQMDQLPNEALALPGSTLSELNRLASWFRDRPGA